MTKSRNTSRILCDLPCGRRFATTPRLCAAMMRCGRQAFASGRRKRLERGRTQLFESSGGEFHSIKEAGHNSHSAKKLIPAFGNKLRIKSETSASEPLIFRYRLHSSG